MGQEDKIKVGSIKILLCPNKNDTNFTADFKQIIWILIKTDETVVTPHTHTHTFWQGLYDITEFCLCDWQPLTKVTAKKHNWVIVEGLLVPFYCIT